MAIEARGDQHTRPRLSGVSGISRDGFGSSESCRTPNDRPATTLRAGVLALWPEAPIAAESAADRWLRFDRHPTGVVYLVRGPRDAAGASRLFVLGCDRRGRRRIGDYATLGEAVAAVRLALTTRPRRRRGAREGSAR